MSFCTFPNDPARILIGDDSGNFIIGTIDDLSSMDLTNHKIKPCLINTTLYAKLGYSSQLIGIRNLVKLNKDEIVGHSYNGDVFIFKCNEEPISLEVIRNGRVDRRNTMYQIAVMDRDHFITSGNYGNIWIFDRDSKGLWDISEKDVGKHAHFALEVYDKQSENYIVNNFRGTTSILDKSGNIISELYGLDVNLQNMIILKDVIAAVDYFGNSHIYVESSHYDDLYVEIQTIDCDNDTKNYPHIVFHENFFYAAFPNNLWKFDSELNIIEFLPLECKDIQVLNGHILVLTPNDIVLINPEAFSSHEDYVEYNYLKAGIIGFTDTGKSTLCYKLIYGDYNDELGTTSGTLTWCFHFSSDKKLFIKDIPGQHAEIDFYFPKLRECDIILAMCKKKDSIEPWKETIDMCRKLREDYGIKHFIFLRSKCDDRQKARKEAIENYLNEKGFDPINLIDISAKNGDGVEELINKLSDHECWDESKISTENRLKTRLLSVIGKARSSKLKKINLDHIRLDGFEELNLEFLEKFVLKIAEEGDIYYIPKRQEIILNTEIMGFVESFILNLFSETEGFIKKNQIMTEIEQNFSEIELQDLKYYYDKFMEYLIHAEKIIEILPNRYIIEDQLKPLSRIPDDYLCTEIVIKNPIDIMEIIALFENKPLEIKEVSKNGITYSDKNNGSVTIVFPDSNEFDEKKKHYKINIYLKSSNIIEQAFATLYETLRNNGLSELPKILNFENKSDDILENLWNLFNYPNESSVIDFKRELNYIKLPGEKLSKIQKEILKDISALGNSAYLYDNSAYLIFGLEEKHGKFISINDIKDHSKVFQQIAYLCRNYLSPALNINLITIRINELFELCNNGKLRNIFQFDSSHKNPECDETIMVLHITRNPKDCIELKKDIFWVDDEKTKYLAKGKGWIRFGSHTFDILNEERRILFIT